MVRFVAVEKIKDQLLENNKQTYWVPDFVKVWFAYTLSLSLHTRTNIIILFLSSAHACLSCLFRLPLSSHFSLRGWLRFVYFIYLRVRGKGKGW